MSEVPLHGGLEFARQILGEGAAGEGGVSGE